MSYNVVLCPLTVDPEKGKHLSSWENQPGKLAVPPPNKDKKTQKQNGLWGPFPSAPGDFPDSSVGKETAYNAGDPGCNSWVGKIPWRRDRLPTPVFLDFSGCSGSKNSTCNVGNLGSIPGREDPLEEGMATHSSTLSWRIPWTEEPGGL